MPWARSALGALLLLAGLLQACSRADPAPKDFARVTEAPARESDAATLQAAQTACKAETRRKGIASVVGILSRLKPGSSDEDYIACMKARGYDAKS